MNGQSLNESYQSCPTHGIVYDVDVVDKCPMCKTERDMRATVVRT